MLALWQTQPNPILPLWVGLPPTPWYDTIYGKERTNMSTEYDLTALYNE